MEVILGIDLGTTNSEVAVVQGGRPILLSDDGDPIVPSVVGLDPAGRLLVGRAARNQFVMSPERTVRSIKRKMGQDVTVPLGDQSFTPQEISAIVLRALKERAEKALGQPAAKAVITVPAFFNESQREATREAGELAGLEVVRIINEPTAAVLTYDPHPPEMERLLVYDLGGGTFDVSIAQVEQGVVEILSSHGDTSLGGDDFDQLLFDLVSSRFETEHGIDLRGSLVARSRLFSAVEEAKKRLSSEPVTVIEEAFIAEKDGMPVNLSMEITREEYERLIEPLLARTLKCLDDAMEDAHLQAQQIDKVLLVGGATRTPLVHRLLGSRLGRPVHSEIEPDLAVAMGAAVQAGLIAGIEVGAVLVDITPYTLGIEVLGVQAGFESEYCFSPIIERNTPLPATRTEIYSTTADYQKEARIRIFQGEGEDTRLNALVGEFIVQGLADVPAPNQVLVRFDLDLNGILRVTATERATGLVRQVVIDNMMERFRKRMHAGALARIESLFDEWSERDESQETQEGTVEASESGPMVGGGPSHLAEDDSELRDAIREADALIGKAGRVESGAHADDAAELQGLLADLRSAMARRSLDDIRRISAEVENVVFYLEDR
ncbi:MAG TPA: Hsp70 family protein [Pirellulales bacterium]|nr:Hsp70 family protein [Pirellulales bacterium]